MWIQDVAQVCEWRTELTLMPDVDEATCYYMSLLPHLNCLFGLFFKYIRSKYMKLKLSLDEE